MVKSPAPSQALATQTLELEPVPQSPGEIKAMDRLSPEGKQAAIQLAKTLNLNDRTAIISFGAKAQQQLANAAASTLKDTAVRDMGPLGAQLSELVRTARSFNPRAILEPPHGLFHALHLDAMTDRMANFLAGYEKVSDKLTAFQLHLDQGLNETGSEISKLDNLFRGVVVFRMELYRFAAALEYLLETDLYPKREALAAKADQTKDPEDAQALRDLNDTIDRVERRINRMQTTAFDSLQTAIQIRAVQSADIDTYELIQDKIVNVVPGWTTGFALAVSTAKLAKQVQLQNAVDDFNNEMKRQNAEMVKNTVIDAAKASNRDPISIETLEKVNQDLISTLQEVTHIEEEARQTRKTNQERREQLERDLIRQMTESPAVQGFLTRTQG